MESLADIEKLEAAHQERFRDIVTRLLGGHVLSPGSALRPDPDFRFADRHRALLDAYLRVGGWRLDFDDALRLCRAVHVRGEQRVRFNKLESLVLCLLRLVYHEQMQVMRDDERCSVTIGELRERMIHAGKPASQLGRRSLQEACRRLARFSLVELGDGFAAEDDEAIVVLPLVEKVLSKESIERLTDRVREYAGRTSGEDQTETLPDETVTS